MGVEEVQNEIDFQKKRLKEAGAETLEWLQSVRPAEFVRENPWLVAGLAAGVGFLLGRFARGGLNPFAPESQSHHER